VAAVSRTTNKLLEAVQRRQGATKSPSPAAKNGVDLAGDPALQSLHREQVLPFVSEGWSRARAQAIADNYVRRYVACMEEARSEGSDLGLAERMARQTADELARPWSAETGALRPDGDGGVTWQPPAPLGAQ
jgi:hypothetical protein